MKTQFAYLAGLIDGEGTLSIYRHRQPHPRDDLVFQPRLMISNTDKGMLDEICQRHGGSVILQMKADAKRRAAYLWRLCSLDAIGSILLEIRPFLISKAARADVLLEFIQLRQRARLARGSQRGYGPRELELQLMIAEQNRRGPCA